MKAITMYSQTKKNPMENEQALLIFKNIISVSLQAGVFKSVEDVSAVLAAYAQIEQSLKPKKNAGN